MRWAVLALALAGCGSVDLAGVDAGVDSSRTGNTDLQAVSADVALEHGITSDVSAERPQVVPPSSSSCAAAAAAAGYPGCETCKGPAGVDLSRQCRAVVDCVASDPKYSPLVETCNMTVGTGNGSDAASACVLGVLRGRGC